MKAIKKNRLGKNIVLVQTKKNVSDLAYELMFHHLHYGVMRIDDNFVEITVPSFDDELMTELLAFCVDF